MAVLFWLCIGLVVYVYVGYPVLAWALARIAGKSVAAAAYEPTVTVVIAAYNEAEHIERTVSNKLEQDYPADKLDVVVVSDSSIDATDDIVKAFGARVQLVRQEPRAGKTAGLNLAVPKATGEILVFSDANSVYAKNGIRQLVRNFADPTIGYVTGKMVYTNPDGTLIGDGCSAYMRYENFLREQESLLASVVGVDGGIDAVRRVLYRTLNADDQSDFVLPLSIAGEGLRVVYDRTAVLKEDALGNQKDEYRMRVRVSLRAMWSLWQQRRLLLPMPRPLLAWQIWSHKVLRYIAFAPILIAMVACAVLALSSTFYLALLGAGLLLMAAGCWAWFKGGRTNKLALFPYYFLLLNVTSMHAFIKLLSGKKQVMWVPRAG